MCMKIITHIAHGNIVWENSRKVPYQVSIPRERELCPMHIAVIL